MEPISEESIPLLLSSKMHSSNHEGIPPSCIASFNPDCIYVASISMPYALNVLAEQLLRSEQPLFQTVCSRGC